MITGEGQNYKKRLRSPCSQPLSTCKRYPDVSDVWVVGDKICNFFLILRNTNKIPSTDSQEFCVPTINAHRLIVPTGTVKILKVITKLLLKALSVMHRYYTEFRIFIYLEDIKNFTTI